MGENAGSTLEHVETRGDSSALRRALTRRWQRRRQAHGTTKGPIETAAEVMSKVEHGANVFVDLAGKRLDIKAAGEEADLLIGLLQRLDRKKRWEDELRVARCLASLLALLARWEDLLDSLRTALRVAEALGDPLSEAWAHHELGTLHLAADRHADADRHLGKAREIRERSHDSRGLAATNHNLQALCKALRQLLHTTGVKRVLHSLARQPALAVALAATIFVIGGVVGEVLAHGPEPNPPVPHLASVSFSFSPSTPHVGQSIVFTAIATDTKDPVASYTWHWGDGDPRKAKVRRHAHVYTAGGRYRVVLVVRDAHRNVIGEATHFVTVQSVPPPVTATETALQCPPSPSPLGEPVPVTGSIKPAYEGAIVKVRYTSPSGREETHELTSDTRGAYTTSLTPEEAGISYIQSSYAGDRTHNASESQRCPLIVERQNPPDIKTNKTSIRTSKEGPG